MGCSFPHFATKDAGGDKLPVFERNAVFGRKLLHRSWRIFSDEIGAVFVISDERNPNTLITSGLDLHAGGKQACGRRWCADVDEKIRDAGLTRSEAQLVATSVEAGSVAARE